MLYFDDPHSSACTVVEQSILCSSCADSHQMVSIGRYVCIISALVLLMRSICPNRVISGKFPYFIALPEQSLLCKHPWPSGQCRTDCQHIFSMLASFSGGKTTDYEMLLSFSSGCSMIKAINQWLCTATKREHLFAVFLSPQFVTPQYCHNIFILWA